MKTPAQIAFVSTLERLINDAPMTQAALAERIGLSSANMITMLKRGTTRLPLGRVAPLARALGQDPQQMIRAWIAAYEPEALPEIDAISTGGLTEAEQSWIKSLRVTFGPVPDFETWARACPGEHLAHLAKAGAVPAS